MQTTPNEKELEKIFSESLDLMEKIAAAAKDHLWEPNHTSLAGSGSWSDPVSLGPMIAAQRGYKLLIQRPLLARIRVRDENTDQEEFYFFAESTVAVEGIKLGSYYSPMGRLAALDVGDGDYDYTILEKTYFDPVKEDNIWDSINTRHFPEKGSMFAFRSLRSWLSNFFNKEPQNQDDLIDVLFGNNIEAEISYGESHEPIKNYGIRKRILLDSVQDKIFRMPIDKLLVLLGPAGTGKTATLIGRLSQKINETFLTEEEKEALRTARQIYGDFDLRESWIMFSPTSLLKRYLVNAFNEKGIPVLEQNLQTWNDFCKILGRDKLNLLQTPNLKNSKKALEGLILDREAKILKPEVEENPKSLFEDFYSWQQNNYLQVLTSKLEDLFNFGEEELIEEIKPLMRIKDSFDGENLTEIVLRIKGYTDRITELKKDNDKRLTSSIFSLINELLHTLPKENLLAFSSLYSDFRKKNIDFDPLDSDELDSKNRKFKPFFGVIKRISENVFLGANPSENSLSAKSFKILFPSSEQEKSLKELGRRVVIGQRLKGVFFNLLDSLNDDIWKRYLDFRSERRGQGKWYLPEKEEKVKKKIQQAELDILTLASLKQRRQLYQSNLYRKNKRSNTLLSQWKTVSIMDEIIKLQVLADEVTDFSPVQLAAMRELTLPSMDSFFACGDLNQRLTNFGIKGIDDFYWALSKDRLDFEKVLTSYRQSSTLLEFSKVLQGFLDPSSEAAKMPTTKDYQGVRPVIREGCPNISEQTNWLRDRILEISHSSNVLPTIAIFVAHEKDVEPLAENLNIALSEWNIDVTPCLNGQVLGDEKKVSVYSIEHIKGLEFEAAFLIGLDALQEDPSLFSRHLYVGATRAATFLGVCCCKKLPKQLEIVRNYFCERWEE